MKQNAPNIKWIETPRLGLLGKLYVTLFTQGLPTTFRHLLGRKQTVASPEVRHKVLNPSIYRGLHRLNRDADGRVRCVACFLCATACPAHCIDIVAEESPWPDRDKYPKHFAIDELRCIFCGMCEEACPVDAIELTPIYDLTGEDREEMIFDRQKLLGVFDMTQESKPMKTDGQQEQRGVPKEKGKDA